MRVRFFFFVKQAAGLDELTVSTDVAPDLRALIGVLVRRFGEPLERQLLTSDGRVREDINILVNGRNIRFLLGLETRLDDGDTVSFLSAVVGG